MKYEKSCGALIFKMIKNKLFVLLIKQTNREWGFPKGHVENTDATDFDTAIREVKPLWRMHQGSLFLYCYINKL